MVGNGNFTLLVILWREILVLVYGVQTVLKINSRVGEMGLNGFLRGGGHASKMETILPRLTAREREVMFAEYSDIEKGAVLLQRLDSHCQVLCCIGLQHKSPRTRLQHLFYELFRVGNGQNQNALQRIVAENLTRGIQSVQTRHANVENDDIRVQLCGLLDCLACRQSE
jgi:hypothetical protein